MDIFFQWHIVGAHHGWMVQAMKRYFLLIFLAFASITNARAADQYWHISSSTGSTPEIACQNFTAAKGYTYDHVEYWTATQPHCYHRQPPGNGLYQIQIYKLTCSSSTPYYTDASGCTATPPPDACEADIESWHEGTGTAAPGQVCSNSCLANLTTAASGGGKWRGWYVTTGDECTGTDAPVSDPLTDPQPTNPDSPYPDCSTANGNETCVQRDKPAPEDPTCGTFNGVEVCIDNGNKDQDPDGHCAHVNGEQLCYSDRQNCGVYNGQVVCVQPPDKNNDGEPDWLGPQTSAPENCIQSGERLVCFNNNPTDTTDKGAPVDNGDGTTTTTETTGSNTKGTGTTTTTTTTNPDGSISTKTTKDGTAADKDGDGQLDDKFEGVDRNEGEDFGTSIGSAWTAIKSTPIVAAIESIAVSAQPGTCAPFSVDYEGQTLSTTMHCDLFTDNAGILTTVLLALWSFVGIRILISA